MQHNIVINKITNRFLLAPQSNWILFLLALLLAFASLSIDLITPALPTLTKVFKASNNEITFLIQSFFIGFAIAHLFWGGLSDRYGRRPILVIGICSYCIATVACLLTNDLKLIVLFRFLQGVGGASCVVLCRAVIRDIYGAENATRAMSSMLVFFAPIPIIMPLLGGFIVSHFHWTTIFWAMLLVAMVILAMVVLLLSETASTKTQETSNTTDQQQGYSAILGNRFFIKNTLATTFCFAGLLICITSFPYYLDSELGFSSQQTGNFFSLFGAALFLGAISVKALVPRTGIVKTLYLGFFQALTGWLILLLLLANGVSNLSYLAFCVVLSTTGIGIVISLTPGQAMVPFKSNSGSASSIYGIMQYGGGTLLAFIMNSLAGPSLTMSIIMLIVASSGALLFYRVFSD